MPKLQQWCSKLEKAYCASLSIEMWYDTCIFTCPSIFWIYGWHACTQELASNSGRSSSICRCDRCNAQPHAVQHILGMVLSAGQLCQICFKAALAAPSSNYSTMMRLCTDICGYLVQPNKVQAT